MFRIPRIEKSSFYFDQALKNMGQDAEKERLKISERFKKTASTQRKDADTVKLDKRKDLELQKIRFLNSRLNQYLRKIVKSFPNFRKVDDIYLKLIDTSDANIKAINTAISEMNALGGKIDDLTQKTEHKIKKAKTQETVGFLMKKYLGKSNSYFKKASSTFETLDEARKFMNKLPTFEDIFTVSIAGFPNVGKSTLMKKITGSDVEIQNYPFTTKGLMFGYVEYKGVKAIQFIDTPGLLGRSKNNQIEARAETVINDYCNLIVFVLDFSESCGYDIESQLRLLKRTSQLGKEILLYFSKEDIFDEEALERISESKVKVKKFKEYRDSNELKEFLIEKMLSQKEKFDPAKIKSI